MGRWVYGLDHNAEKGEGKEAEGQVPWRLLGLEPGVVLRLACTLTLRPGIVLRVRDCVCLPLDHARSPSAFSPTHPYSHREQRPHKEQTQAGEASWLKEVRKGEE